MGGGGGKTSGQSSKGSTSQKGSSEQNAVDLFSSFLQNMGWGGQQGQSLSQNTGFATGQTSGASQTGTTGTSATTGTGQTQTFGQTAGGSQQQTLSPYAAPLANFGQSLQNIAAPTLKLYGAQTAEALRTGGVNAQIPIINRSTDAARQALTGSNEQLRQNLARSGMGGTAAGQQAISSNLQQGQEDIAGIGPGIANQFIQGAPGFGTSVAGQGAGALGTAMQGNIGTRGTYTQQNVQNQNTAQQQQTAFNQNQNTTYQQNTAQQTLQNQYNTFNQLYQNFLNQQQGGSSRNQAAATSSGVGTQAGSQTSTPSFWDVFNQGLGTALAPFELQHQF